MTRIEFSDTMAPWIVGRMTLYQFAHFRTLAIANDNVNFRGKR